MYFIINNDKGTNKDIFLKIKKSVLSEILVLLKKEFFIKNYISVFLGDSSVFFSKFARFYNTCDFIHNKRV